MEDSNHEKISRDPPPPRVIPHLSIASNLKGECRVRRRGGFRGMALQPRRLWRKSLVCFLVNPHASGSPGETLPGSCLPTCKSVVKYSTAKGRRLTISCPRAFNT